MDETRFDALTKALVVPRTRRRMLGVLGGGALASFGSIALAAKSRNKEDRNFKRRCIPSPKRCGLKPKGPHGSHPCKRCCYTYRTLGASRGQCCQPNGYGCRSAAECCLGVCSVGLCQNEVIQLLPPCVAYGGSCTQNGECCDGVPCSGSLCQFPPPQPPPDPPPCVPYGQPCSTVAACCPLQDGSPIPCSGGLCRFN